MSAGYDKVSNESGRLGDVLGIVIHNGWVSLREGKVGDYKMTTL